MHRSGCTASCRRLAVEHGYAELAAGSAARLERHAPTQPLDRELERSDGRGSAQPPPQRAPSERDGDYDEEVAGERA